MAISLKYLIAALSCLIVLYGCEEDFTSTSIKIDGRAVSIDNIQCSNILVRADRFASVLTDYNGMFHLEIKSFPYNLTINNRQVISGLTILNPVIAFDYGFTTYANVFVRVPPISTNEVYFIGFISENDFSCSPYIFTYEDSTANLQVMIPNYQQEINGFVYVMRVSQGYYYPLSYDKFGYKQVQIKIAKRTYLNFSEDDLNYNINERYLAYNINGLPDGYFYNDIILTFKSFSYSSNIKLNFQPLTSRSSLVLVPTDLPIDFRFQIKSTGRDNTTYPYNEKVIYTEKEENPVINHYNFINLISPANNAANIDENTELISESPLSSNCVNVFNVYSNDTNSINYCTTSKSIKIKELIDAGLVMYKNTLYRWYVSQLYPFNSTNDLCTGNYMQRYTDGLTSRINKFISKP